MNTTAHTLAGKFISEHHASNPINSLWSNFKNLCKEIMDTVPSKTTKQRFSQTWITTPIKKLSRRKHRAYNIARKTNKHKDWERYRSLKKKVQTECRTTHNNHINNIVTGEDSKCKRLWSYMKGLRRDNSGIAPLKRDGLLHSDPKTKAELLNNQLSSVFTSEDKINMPELGQSKTDNIPTLIVHQEGVAKLLRNLNPHKATGPEEISAQLLKTNAKQPAEPLSKFVQASIDQGKIPDDWKEALLTPLFKKGDKSTPSNYRPVSLTSICSKVLEHIIHSHIMKHLNKHQILTDHQHRFRASRSCESQLLITINNIAKSMNTGEQLDAILLDFSKAFDKVPYQRLLLKRHCGIRGNLLDWIEDFLSERTQRVLVEGQHTSSAKVTS
jgi:hypothetical protein